MVPVPEASAQALIFDQARTVLWIVEGFWSLAILVLLCWTGWSARMRNFAERVSPKFWPGSIAVYAVIFIILISTWRLPITWLRELLRIEFGLSSMSATVWIVGQLSQMVVTTVVAALLLWIPYLLYRRFERRAWLYAWFGLAALMITMKVIGPLVIDPLTEPSGPIRNVHLGASLQAMARDAGMEGVRIVEDSTTAGAGAMRADARGLGPGARILLSGAVTTSSEAQARFVVAHEMAHIALGHLWQDTVLALMLMLFTFFAVQSIGESMSRQFSSRFGFSSLTDVASVPLVLALLSIASAVATPLENALASHEERQADVYALELTRNNQAAAETLVKAQHSNLLNPRPNRVIHALRHAHPPLAERVEFANSYRPWETGSPMQYGHMFRRISGTD